ncbi:hypothetical protein F4804DRAFT_271460 [Jackrogersella minutella]|nr:hypothetical protein F4804DRAFT_271460 [Jackrogersella minutella]
MTMAMREDRNKTYRTVGRLSYVLAVSLISSIRWLPRNTTPAPPRVLALEIFLRSPYAVGVPSFPSLLLSYSFRSSLVFFLYCMYMRRHVGH